MTPSDQRMFAHPRHLCAALSTASKATAGTTVIRTQISCHIFGRKYPVPVRTSSGRLLFIFAEPTFNTVQYTIKAEFSLHRRRLHRRSLPHHLFERGGCSLPAGRVSGNGKKKRCLVRPRRLFHAHEILQLVVPCSTSLEY